MFQCGQWAFYGMLMGMFCANSAVWAQAPAAENLKGSPAQAVLNDASAAGKFTFLVFYKDDHPAVRKMADIVKAGVQKRADQTVAAFVQITNPAEQPLVDRFQVARAAMPLTLTIAPNGAVTGIFSKEVTDESMSESLVTPTMTRCMKSLQENRLVFVCVQTGDQATVPLGLKEMQADPQFKDRIVSVSMQMRDPAETRFLNQMQIDPQATTSPTTVLLAPPGVMIGKFDVNATGAQMAAALHKAGKCCDDPNCKHNHGASSQTTRPNSIRRK